MPSHRFRLNGARGFGVLVLGTAATLRGVAYLPPLDTSIQDLPGGLRSITEVVTLNTWGILWLLVGLYGIRCAFCARDVKAISYIVGMTIVWGLAYTWGWLDSVIGPEPVNRDWLSAVNYLSMSLFIISVIKLVPEQEQLPIAPFSPEEPNDSGTA